MATTKGNAFVSDDIKKEAIKAEKLLKKYFGSSNVTRVGQKQIYFIENYNGDPFYVQVTSAPSNVKFTTAVKGTLRELDGWDMYILFTRDIETYPEGEKSYWSNVKKLYTIRRKFAGVIMGLNNFTKQITDQMVDNLKIDIDYQSYLKQLKQKPDVIKALVQSGFKPSQAKLAAQIVTLIFKIK